MSSTMCDAGFGGPAAETITAQWRLVRQPISSVRDSKFRAAMAFLCIRFLCNVHSTRTSTLPSDSFQTLVLRPCGPSHDLIIFVLCQLRFHEDYLISPVQF